MSVQTCQSKYVSPNMSDQPYVSLSQTLQTILKSPVVRQPKAVDKNHNEWIYFTLWFSQTLLQDDVLFLQFRCVDRNSGRGRGSCTRASWAVQSPCYNMCWLQYEKPHKKSYPQNSPSVAHFRHAWIDQNCCEIPDTGRVPGAPFCLQASGSSCQGLDPKTYGNRLAIDVAENRFVAHRLCLDVVGCHCHVGKKVFFLARDFWFGLLRRGDDARFYSQIWPGQIGYYFQSVASSVRYHDCCRHFDQQNGSCVETGVRSDGRP